MVSGQDIGSADWILLTAGPIKIYTLSDAALTYRCASSKPAIDDTEGTIVRGGGSDTIVAVQNVYVRAVRSTGATVCFLVQPKTDAMPAPSSIVPPPVSDTGAKGQSVSYAREDHTHVSSMFATVVATVNTSGNVTWSYPADFFIAAPVIALTVEDASSNAMQAKLLTNTKDGGSAKIIASRPLASALNSLLSFDVFGGTVPAGTKLHVLARKARPPS